MLGEQGLAGGGLQPDQAQGTHRAAAARQRPQLSGFLPAGEQQTTLVPRFGDPLQQPRVSLVAGTQMAPHLAFLQQAFQVVQHQQHP